MEQNKGGQECGDDLKSALQKKKTKISLQQDPAKYIADEQLLDAVKTALWLGQPLLLTGEPGCGKTELAHHLAWRLDLAREIPSAEPGEPQVEYALRFDTKSETRARDMFYTIDTIERFHTSHFEKDKAKLEPLNFVTFHALGRAILYARGPDDLSDRLPDSEAHPGTPQRSVVLIDEIDKAPRDVPNDLLMEFEQMRFFMPEANRMVRATKEQRPVLVITSNSEKALPEAFLRRCCYYNMTFPGTQRLRDIVATRLEGLDQDSPLVRDSVEIFQKVRNLPLRKPPATAELLGFVSALLGADFGPNEPVKAIGGWETIARATLLKTREDQGRSIEAAIANDPVSA